MVIAGGRGNETSFGLRLSQPCISNQATITGFALLLGKCRVTQKVLMVVTPYG
jgi:hypothetical protein